jgi:PAS domain S-box-containing protein
MSLEEVSRDIVEHSPDALVVLDREAVVRYWNGSAARIFGFSEAQAVGRDYATLIGVGEDCGEQQDLARAAAGERVSRELTRRRHDGTLIHVRCTVQAQFAEDGQVQFFHCSVSDLTPERVAQDARLARSRYQGLLDSMPDAVVIVNDSGRIVLFNAQAASLFGHAPEHMIGLPVENLMPERLRAQHLPQRSGYLQAPRRRPMGRDLELLGLHADGREFPVEISLSPLEVEGRRMAISAIRDISDRKRIERALQEKNLELERANGAKDRFLATMSHELRTPLNAVLGFTGLLLMRLPGPLTEKQERQLQHVQASGQHLLSLINDLLDLAKIESGRVELAREAVDCRGVVDEVVTTLRPLAQARHLTIEAELQDADCHALGDRRAMQQVLLNLVGNAIKFTEHGGVVLAVEACEHRGLPAVAICVSDTGIGIAADDLRRLFDAFVQVGDTRHRRGEGTGLGLHLSRKLAELMGGELTATSEPDRGSRFTLILSRVG